MKRVRTRSILAYFIESTANTHGHQTRCRYGTFSLLCSTASHIPSFVHLPSPTARMIVLLRSFLLNDNSLWWWSSI